MPDVCDRDTVMFFPENDAMLHTVLLWLSQEEDSCYARMIDYPQYDLFVNLMKETQINSQQETALISSFCILINSKIVYVKKLKLL